MTSISNPSRPVQTSTMAIWSLVLGILSIVGCFLFAGIPAVICGHAARKRIRSSGGNEQGEGLALAGLILGYLGLALSAFLLLDVFAAIAIPPSHGNRGRAQENTTRGTIKALESSVDVYMLDHSGQLPASLQDIVPYLHNASAVPKDAWGSDFIYRPDNAASSFTITSPGKDGVEGTGDDITN